MGLAGHNYSFGVGGELHFQEGPAGSDGMSTNGTQALDVLRAVKNYLEIVNSGIHENHYTTHAISDIANAMGWLEERNSDRQRRNVEGTNTP